jgi:hypothetical protein
MYSYDVRRKNYISLNCVNQLVTVKIIQCALLEEKAEFLIFRGLISGLKRLKQLQLKYMTAPYFTAIYNDNRIKTGYLNISDDKKLYFAMSSI